MVSLLEGGGAKPKVAFDLPDAFGRRALHDVARAPFLSAMPWCSAARGKAVVDVYERAIDEREALRGYAEALLELPGRGCASVRDLDGSIALHHACAHGNTWLVRMLTAAVDSHLINALNARGWTPLALALYHGHNECARVLLEVHANPLVCNVAANQLADSWVVSTGRLVGQLVRETKRDQQTRRALAHDGDQLERSATRATSPPRPTTYLLHNLPTARLGGPPMVTRRLPHCHGGAGGTRDTRTPTSDDAMCICVDAKVRRNRRARRGEARDRVGPPPPRGGGGRGREGPRLRRDRCCGDGGRQEAAGSRRSTLAHQRRRVAPHGAAAQRRRGAARAWRTP